MLYTIIKYILRMNNMNMFTRTLKRVKRLKIKLLSNKKYIYNK